MRKIIAITQLSLDGVMQAPGGPEEDPRHRFTQGGWFMRHGDSGVMKELNQVIARKFDLLLGRRTYDIWAAYWPRVPAGHAIADLFNRVPKHVATHRADALGWQNSHALKGELASAIHELKQQSGASLLTWRKRRPSPWRTRPARLAAC